MIISELVKGVTFINAYPFNCLAIIVLSNSSRTFMSAGSRLHTDKELKEKNNNNNNNIDLFI